MLPRKKRLQLAKLILIEPGKVFYGISRAQMDYTSAFVWVIVWLPAQLMNYRLIFYLTEKNASARVYEYNAVQLRTNDKLALSQPIT